MDKGVAISHSRYDLFVTSFLSDRLLLGGRRASRRRHGREPQQGDRVVIGGHPILPLNAAAVAAMDHELLAIRPKRDANRWH